MAFLLFFHKNNAYRSDTILATGQEQRHPVKNADIRIPQCDIQQPSFRNQTVKKGNSTGL